MTITIYYFNSCRRDRLHSAFAHTVSLLGSNNVAAVTEALVKSYKLNKSTRINYNIAMHALRYVVGLEGLAAISVIKEAWAPGCLTRRGQGGQEPATNATNATNAPTHPSTNTLQ